MAAGNQVKPCRAPSAAIDRRTARQVLGTRSERDGWTCAPHPFIVLTKLPCHTAVMLPQSATSRSGCMSHVNPITTADRSRSESLGTDVFRFNR